MRNIIVEELFDFGINNINYKCKYKICIELNYVSALEILFDSNMQD